MAAAAPTTTTATRWLSARTAASSRFRLQDVAFIDFAGNGTVSQNELNRANQSYDGLVVLRNGRTMVGRMVDLQGSNNQAVVSSPSGELTVPMNQVARVYFGNAGATSGYSPYTNPNQNVYGNNNPQYGQNGQYDQYGQYGQNGQYTQPLSGTARTVTIPSNQLWSNSGIDVRRGEIIHFQASGNVALSRNPGDNGDAGRRQRWAHGGQLAAAGRRRRSPDRPRGQWPAVRDWRKRGYHDAGERPAVPRRER